MKVMFCLSVIFMAVSSFGVELPALPPSEYADTEVSTNFAFAVESVEAELRQLGFGVTIH